MLRSQKGNDDITSLEGASTNVYDINGDGI